MVLDEESRKYVVINTHRGLFQYNHLPFGIASAPGIFQRTMESILSGIPNVVVYLDDILVTGPTEEAHLATLEEQNSGSRTPSQEGEVLHGLISDLFRALHRCPRLAPHPRKGESYTGSSQIL